MQELNESTLTSPKQAPYGLSRKKPPRAVSKQAVIHAEPNALALTPKKQLMRYLKSARVMDLVSRQ